jgi:hypothetical protein
MFTVSSSMEKALFVIEPGVDWLSLDDGESA